MRLGRATGQEEHVSFRDAPPKLLEALWSVDRTIRPDAEMIRPQTGKRYFVELHTGTVRGRDRIEDRFRVYAGCPNDVLWVSLDPAERDKLVRQCDQSNMFFTTLPEVASNPLGSVWTDCEGHLCEIE